MKHSNESRYTVSRSRQSRLTMDSLPDEILFEILDFLDVKDLQQARLISRRWREIIDTLTGQPSFKYREIINVLREPTYYQISDLPKYNGYLKELELLTHQQQLYLMLIYQEKQEEQDKFEFYAINLTTGEKLPVSVTLKAGPPDYCIKNYAPIFRNDELILIIQWTSARQISHALPSQEGEIIEIFNLTTQENIELTEENLPLLLLEDVPDLHKLSFLHTSHGSPCINLTLMTHNQESVTIEYPNSESFFHQQYIPDARRLKYIPGVPRVQYTSNEIFTADRNFPETLQINLQTKQVFSLDTEHQHLSVFNLETKQETLFPFLTSGNRVVAMAIAAKQQKLILVTKNENSPTNEISFWDLQTGDCLEKQPFEAEIDEYCTRNIVVTEDHLTILFSMEKSLRRLQIYRFDIHTHRLVHSSSTGLGSLHSQQNKKNIRLTDYDNHLHITNHLIIGRDREMDDLIIWNAHNMKIIGKLKGLYDGKYFQDPKTKRTFIAGFKREEKHIYLLAFNPSNLIHKTYRTPKQSGQANLSFWHASNSFLYLKQDEKKSSEEPSFKL